ncbi:hypothetical protein [Phycisphaera mikurensis]|uniref:Uncharacterized protein n=1 Tax=Phycisphaera mikurensis (strain NBRC 102666 / KCTC 22515 / FYK2301M01) TaxID=1142394 RepID=I0ICN5_PHYMF|nr:hypothetical protein [Phycisphaera mikurensis]MBB6442102.1 hypothetical protein [Phycisphaera mikurensis]BAM03023.1 hypothetical protein PSMK_08640 [Phycisphaera mikurensis NBRC 102666]
MTDLAIITTVYRPESHTDVIMARWLEDIPADPHWGWNGPRTSIVSAYVAQFPENDLARERFGDAGIPLHGSIAAALRNGGDRLAVGGVLLVAEHGEYPFNRYGQHLYPRAEMFHAILDVMEEDGRTAPVFFDKHLSWDFDLGRLMLERARSLNVPVLSASSLPLCRYGPPIRCDGEAVEEIVAVYPLVDGGNPESYGYHSLEVVQQFAERRAGGAAGVVRVQGWRGGDAWAACDAGLWSRPLFEAAWSRSLGDAKPREEPIDALYEAESGLQPTCVFTMDHADGLRVTHVGVDHFQDFALAARVGGETRSSVILGGEGGVDRHSNFAALARMTEDWILDGVEPFPPTRALLTCGTLQAMCNALALRSGALFPTPHLADLHYRPAPTPVGADHWNL